jgi:hypothetical protein
MLGSKKRDYKTEARATDRALKAHQELMKKYIDEGMSKDEASKKAYAEVMKMKISGKKNWKPKKSKKEVKEMKKITTRDQVKEIRDLIYKRDALREAREINPRSVSRFDKGELVQVYITDERVIGILGEYDKLNHEFRLIESIGYFSGQDYDGYCVREGEGEVIRMSELEEIKKMVKDVRCKFCGEELVNYGGAGKVCSNPDCEGCPEVLRDDS